MRKILIPVITIELSLAFVVNIAQAYVKLLALSPRRNSLIADL